MDDKTLKLMNKIISILSCLDYNLTTPNMYFEKINKDRVKEYIRFTILKYFSYEDLLKLGSKIFYIGKNYKEAGILIKDNKVSRVLIPELDNILTAIIICHELTHYVAYKNKLGAFTFMSLYDELIPINEEGKFLTEFYYEYLNEHMNYRFNEVVNIAHRLCNLSTNGKLQNINTDINDTNNIINQLSHIYSILILMKNNDYKSNSILFERINNSNKPLEYEFHKNGIYLKKNIIGELKRRF